jgi:hypothetical protein
MGRIPKAGTSGEIEICGRSKQKHIPVEEKELLVRKINKQQLPASLHLGLLLLLQSQVRFCFDQPLGH